MFKQCTNCVWSDTFIDIDIRGDSELPKGYSVPGRLFLLYDTSKQNSDKQNAISYFTYDTPQYLCEKCHKKYSNGKFTTQVIERYDIIDVGTQKYNDFLKKNPLFSKEIGIGNFLYPDNTQSAIEGAHMIGLPFSRTLDIPYDKLMQVQNIKNEKSSINKLANEIRSAISDHSNESDSDSQDKASDSDSQDNISVYDPAADASDEIESKSNGSMHNKNFSLKEARAIVLYLRDEPLAAVAKEDQQNIFKTHKFKKYMREQSLGLRKAKSYVQLYAIK